MKTLRSGDTLVPSKPADGEGWRTIPFGEFATLQRGKDLTKSQFRDGSVPVGGSNGIIGYHDTAIAKGPGITVGRSGSAGKVTYFERDFWPHNTALYVKDFHGNDPLFTRYFFGYLDLSRFKTGASVPTLDRNSFKMLPVVVPPLPEQKKIAHILSTVQRAIEEQVRIIQCTNELKKGLVHKLFSEGLHSELQKQTDIGPIPKSWKLICCDDLCEMVTVGVVVKPASHYVLSGVPAFRSFNVREDRLAANKLVYFTQKTNDTVLSKSKLRTGDVLVVRTGYPGTSCVVPEEYNGSNAIDLVIVRPNSRVVRSGFLSRFFNAPAGKRQAVAAKHGLAQQHLNVAAVKRTLVPLPLLEEQDEIEHSLATVQRKLANVSAKKASLELLFRNLLHDLMTAKLQSHPTSSLQKPLTT